MYGYISKILGILVMPIGVIFLLLLVALVLFVRSKRKTALGVLSLTLLFAWLCSMPVVGEDLLGQLEQDYPRLNVEQISPGDCIVLLGGSVSPGKNRREGFGVKSTPRRMQKAIELFNAGKAPLIIISAGNQPWRDDTQTEAELIRHQMMKKSVPGDAIVLEMSARNTRENAVYTQNILANMNCGQPLLVTSAAHMFRAVAAFRAVGVEVSPVTTDHRVGARRTTGIRGFLPSLAAFNMTSRAVRERVARKVYEYRGWN